MTSTPAPRLLKAKDARGIGSGIAFNYEDLQRRSSEHLERARQEAARVLDEARVEAEAIRRRAFEEARQDGLKQGLADAQDEIQKRAVELADEMAGERLKTVLPALGAAAQALTLERDRWLTEWETAAIRLSAAIAGRVLRRRLDAEPQIAGEMIRGALELAAGSSEVRLRLHPADLETLGRHGDDVIESITGCSAASLVPDDALARGGCLVETRHGTIDARIETQLERLASELMQFQ